MALPALDEQVPITVQARATKDGDVWVIDIAGPPRVSVRVASLEDVDAAVNALLERDPPASVHVYWYH